MPITSKSGFSLIQMALLLAVGSLLLVSLLPGGQLGSDPEKAIVTAQRMQKIEEATRAFMVTNLRRPCPADASIAIGAATFGQEAQYPGNCQTAVAGGAAGTPAANLPPTPSTATSYSVAGGVPTRTLGLPDEYSLDGYGHRIMYVVDKRATNSQTCHDLQSQGTAGVIRIAETETSGGVYSAATSFKDYTMWALMSYGKDGDGAYTEQGNATRLTGTSANVDKNYNAFCITTSPYTTCTNAYYLDTLVQKSPDPLSTTNRFDDIVWYLNATKNTCCVGKQCDQGFRITGVASDLAGIAVAVGDVNGDGIPDLIIGAQGTLASNVGNVYVIFGRLTGWPTGGLSTATPFAVTTPASTSILNSTATSSYSITGVNSGTGIVTAAGLSAAAGSYAYINGVVGMPQLNGNCFKISAANQLEDMLGNYLSISPYFFTAYASGGAVLNSCGAVIVNNSGYHEFGATLAVGDINSDGYDDIVIGALSTTGGVTTTVVVLGSANFASANTSALTMPYGFILTGAGVSDALIAIGNVDGDGYKDIILTDQSTSPYTAWVLYGDSTTNLAAIGGMPNVTLTNLLPSQGFKIIAPDAISALAAGDMNSALNGSNNLDDIVIGRYTANGGEGEVDVLLGQTKANWIANVFDSAVCASNCSVTLATQLTSHDPANAVKFTSTTAADQLGLNIIVTDFNNDGIADLIASSTNYVYGSKGVNPLVNSFGDVVLSSSNAFKIDAITNRPADFPAAPSPFPLKMAVGDLNGDGLPDIVLTILSGPGTNHGYSATRNSAGSTFVLFQPPGGWTGNYTMFDANSPATSTSSWFDKYGNPTTLTTSPYYLQEFRADGNAFAAAITPAIGDLNGDGKNDLFIGASLDGSGAGAVYVLWGRAPYGTNPVPWQSNGNVSPSTTDPNIGRTGVIDLNTIQ